MTMELMSCSFVLFMSTRRRKSEQTQQLMLWKIEFEDIDFLSEGIDSRQAKSPVITYVISEHVRPAAA